MNDRLIPPSEKAELRRKQEEEAARLATQRAENLKAIVRRIGETPDGLEFFRWLREECGGNQSILGAIQGQIDEKATMYQAMRLNLWIKVRRMLSFNILKEVEYDPDQIS